MNLKKARVILLAVIIPAILLLTGCDSREGDGINYDITSMTVSPNSLYADQEIITSAEVRVTVEDNQGFPAVGISVSFEADLGYIQGKVYTDDYGVALTSFNDNGLVGMAHINASVEGGQVVRDSVEVLSNPHLSIVRITANPGTIYLDNGITSSEIEVLVQDQDGFAATNEDVYFRASIGNIISHVTTDSSGIASTSFWDAGIEGTCDIDAFVGVTDTTITVVIAPQPEVIDLALDVVSNEITINTVRTIDAFAVNVIGSVPNGTAITFETEFGFFQTSASDNTYLGKSVTTTTSNGSARAFLNAGTQAGTGVVSAEIVASVDSLGIETILSDEETMTFMAGRPTQMTLIPKNENEELQSIIPVNSPEDLYVWAYVRDSFGNPVRNDYVVLFTSDLGTIMSPVPITDGGIAVATYSAGIQAGVAQITAIVDSATASTAITIISDDVNSIQFINQAQISIDVQGTGGVESAELAVNLFDMNGNMIDESVEVWFKFLVRPENNYPEGSNINTEVYNLSDSTSTISSNGMAVISVNSGTESGIIKIQAWCRNLEGQKISASKPNIIVQSGPADQCEFAISGNDSGEDMDGGMWKVQIAALITDEWGNPVGNGTAAYFSLDPNPDYASVEAADAFVGNENSNGDSLSGTAFSYLIYDGTYTNEMVNVNVDVGSEIEFDGELKLPLQNGEITMVCTPIHCDWVILDDWEDKETQCRVTVHDSQQNPISNQRIIFTSSIGDPTDDGIHPIESDITDPIILQSYDWDGLNDDDDPHDGFTGWYDGDLGVLFKSVIFHKYECLPPGPGGPGMATAAVTANIFGTNTSLNSTITLWRYTD
ncbi:MAG: hypothetical protein RAO94_08985 [Candidatus Stygibacter australis]|nr:hypothetical protein [Candidatus Stygibacter australis]